MTSSKRISWSCLPKEALEMIKNRLIESPSDVCNFRSVCSSWRSSLTPPVFNTLPFPDNILFDCEGGTLSLPATKTASLRQTTIYSFKPLVPSLSLSPSSWLVAMKLVDGKHHLLSGWIINRDCYQVPKEINLCDFRITELHKVYSIEVEGDVIVNALLISNQYYGEQLLAVPYSNNVIFYKLESSRWVLVKKVHHTSPILDVVIYQGRIWSVSSDGRVYVYTSSLDASKVSRCLLHPKKRHRFDRAAFYFVKSSVDLFVVRKTTSFMRFSIGFVPWKIYKLAFEENRFVEVRHLDNRVFVIQDFIPVSWSFSLPPFRIPGGPMRNLIVCFNEFYEEGAEYYQDDLGLMLLSLETFSSVWEIEGNKKTSPSFKTEIENLFLAPPNWIKN